MYSENQKTVACEDDNKAIFVFYAVTKRIVVAVTHSSALMKWNES